jgi:cysteine desulfurase/selenocysteine lyase
MSTKSELPSAAGVGLPVQGGGYTDPFAFARELASMANALFGQAALPSPELPPSGAPAVPEVGPGLPPRMGPSALAVGAGGASPAVSVPPIPGYAKALPPVETPFPRDSDLRSVAGAAGEHLFDGATIPLVQSVDAGPTTDLPYFLSLLNQAPATPEAAPPGLPAAPSIEAPSWSFAPEVVPELRATQAGTLDANVVRRDFPILNERVHGKRLIWLDNGATTQKPKSVIERISHFYEHENSNIHRAAHALAARATDAYEAARDKTRDFLGADSSDSIVFVRGTTEAINLVAYTFGRTHLRSGDEILISWLEHHANIVPWQQLCTATGARLCVAPVDDHGELILSEYQRLLSPRTKLVSITHVSNALGTINPVAELTALAKRQGACVLIDGAQAVSHMPVNVREIGCDFYVFSGHKVFAPTGIGALYGRPEVLATLPPFQGGGNMIADVTFERTVYQPPPARFEAGTGNIADAVGLGAAIDYVTSLGMANISHYEHGLLRYAEDQLLRIPGLRIYGTAREKAGVISFVLSGYTTEEVGKALDLEGIAVRSGHHCAQPILRRFGLESTVRASLAPYNSCEDIDALVGVVRDLRSKRPV